MIVLIVVLTDCWRLDIIPTVISCYNLYEFCKKREERIERGKLLYSKKCQECHSSKSSKRETLIHLEIWLNKHLHEEPRKSMFRKLGPYVYEILDLTYYLWY